MTRTVQRRGAKPRRSVAPRRAARAMPAPPVVLPVAPRRFYRRVAAAFALLLIVGGGVTAAWLRLPQAWWEATEVAAARAGFEVRQVETHGLHYVGRLDVMRALLDGSTDSMLRVDLAAARAKLLAMPWVADASVGRRLPDTLVVHIVERRPVALWQYRHRLVVVDRTGRPLTADRLERFSALPLVVGAGAGRNAHALADALSNLPALARQVHAAQFVGGRRWDVRFKSGETLALPEGDAAAARALAQFAALDTKGRLLAQGFTRFDMREPARMTVRGPGIGAALARLGKTPKAVTA